MKSPWRSIAKGCSTKPRALVLCAGVGARKNSGFTIGGGIPISETTGKGVDGTGRHCDSIQRREKRCPLECCTLLYTYSLLIRPPIIGYQATIRWVDVYRSIVTPRPRPIILRRIHRREDNSAVRAAIQRLSIYEVRILVSLVSVH